MFIAARFEVDRAARFPKSLRWTETTFLYRTAPNVCAYVERWIQSIQIECLNHFVVLGEKHFNYLVSTYVNYYLGHRPHQGLDNKPLDGSEPDDDVPRLTTVRSQSWLGGLLQSYSRKAA
jgi:hypothetical protein